MIFKWKIFTVDLNPVKGSEQKGIRPVVVISDDDYSFSIPLVTILPITSLKPGRKIYPNEVLIEKDEIKNTGLSIDFIIMAHQIRTVSKNRLIRNIGSIDSIEIMEEVNEALRIHLNL